MMKIWTEMPEIFPLMRGGGIFLAAVGLGILVGAFGGDAWLTPALIAGAALGIIGMAIGGITKWIFAGIGKPKIWQWVVLGIAVLVEGYLVSLVATQIPNHSSREFLLWILFVVGVHFLILTFSHGPICGLLGLVCMVNAYIGLMIVPIPYKVFWGLDGIFKIIAGVAMVRMSFNKQA